MRKQRKIICTLMVGILFVTGCQETPEKSGVVSRGEGLNESVVAEPLEKGEKREMDIPKHWQMEEKKSNNRVTICANLDMEEKEIGNLPVIEMKNHVISQEELEKLVEYFARDEILYVPQPYTKSVYEEIMTRIENQEGIYGSMYAWMEPLKIRQGIESALVLAPEIPAKPEEAEVKFTTRFVDVAYEEAITSQMSYIDDFNLYENRNEKIWFEADVGENRESRIQAETYDSKVGNSSDFCWIKGEKIMEYTAFSGGKMFFESQEDHPFTPQILERLQLFSNRYEQGEQEFDKNAGEEQAKQMLSELGIDQVSLLSRECVLWFSKEDYPNGRAHVGEADDFWWRVDPKNAEFGYSYTFSRNIGGVNVMPGNSAVIERTEAMYSPPFPVETITITVTESGVKKFEWKGISEEERVIAENTSILPFEQIQEKLVDQIFFWYSGKGQPEYDKTQFQYQITEATLGYTYITAYENPEHAWLVPAWSFQMVEGSNGRAFQYLTYLIEALEGRVIIEE